MRFQLGFAGPVFLKTQRVRITNFLINPACQIPAFHLCLDRDAAQRLTTSTARCGWAVILKLSWNMHWVEQSQRQATVSCRNRNGLLQSIGLSDFREFGEDDLSESRPPKYRRRIRNVVGLELLVALFQATFA